MNPEQIDLIQSSWKKVLPIADTAADLFYDRLFETAPGVRDLFPEDMAGQKKALLAMLGRVVASLNDLGSLVPAVQDLGVRHIGYGTDPEHYPVVGATLLWTLEQGLGDEWNDDLKEAWSAAYGVLSETMIDAAKAHANAEEEAEARAEQEEAERKEAETAARAESAAKTEAAAQAEQEEAERKAVEEAEAPAKAEAEAKAKAELEAEKSAKKKKRRSGSGSFGASKTAEQKKTEEAQASGPQRQLVVFELDEERYGLDISAVREIIRLQEITDIPRTPDFVEGVINLRGNVIPVVDLRKRFEMESVERDEDFRIVVVDVSGNEIGMIVDAVTEVSRVPESGIEPPSSVIAADDADYLTGIAKTGNEMIILLNIGKLISIHDMRKLSKATSESPEQSEEQGEQLAA